MSEKTLGSSMLLDNTSGNITDGMARKTVYGVGLLATTIGTITITGIVDSGGSPVTWTIAPGTSGTVAPPGAGVAWKLLSYSLSNAADVNQAFIAWR